MTKHQTTNGIASRILRVVTGVTPERDVPYLDILFTFEANTLTLLLEKPARRKLSHIIDRIQQDGTVVLRDNRFLLDDLSPWEWIRCWLREGLYYVGSLQVNEPEFRGGMEDKGHLIHLVYRIDHFTNFDTRVILLLLGWSIGLWELATSDSDESTSEDDLLDPYSKFRVNTERYKPADIAMAKALSRRGVPWSYADYVNPHMFLVGYGEMQRFISHRLTDKTSGWSMNCVKSKTSCRQLLSDAGIPVAPGSYVQTFEMAVNVAEQLGYPLVVKPNAADQGEAVSTGIQDIDMLRDSYEKAYLHGSGILLEKMVEGSDYRFFIVNGLMMAALERLPAGVTGDGKATIRQLIELENFRRRQSPMILEGGHMSYFLPIDIDQEAIQMLDQQGLILEDIPPKGMFVRMRFTANLSCGGTVRECKAEVHPSIERLLRNVVTLLRLDVAGIDIMTPTVARPLEDVGGVIIEVNAMPGVIPHMIAEPQRLLIDETTIELLQWRPEDIPPIVACLGLNDISDLLWLEEVLRAYFSDMAISNKMYALTSQGRNTDGVNDLHGRHVQVLRDPHADAFLLEVDLNDLDQHGLAVPSIDLLIVGEMAPHDLARDSVQWLYSRAYSVCTWAEVRRDLIKAPVAKEHESSINMPRDSRKQSIKHNWLIDRIQHGVLGRFERYTA